MSIFNNYLHQNELLCINNLQTLDTCTLQFRYKMFIFRPLLAQYSSVWARLRLLDQVGWAQQNTNWSWFLFMICDKDVLRLLIIPKFLSRWQTGKKNIPPVSESEPRVWSNSTRGCISTVGSTVEMHDWQAERRSNWTGTSRSNATLLDCFGFDSELLKHWRLINAVQDLKLLNGVFWILSDK